MDRSPNIWADGKPIPMVLEGLKFGYPWVKNWRRRYRVSFKKSIKRYAIPGPIRNQTILDKLRHAKTPGPWRRTTMLCCHWIL